jgi:hypothetical protein
MVPMASLAEFLDRLLSDGSAILRSPPVLSKQDARDAIGRLESAFADVRLDIAGPALPFDAPAAVAAAEFVWRACWFLVQRGQPEAEAARVLIPPAPPATAAQHLSADMTLRFLPPVLRRARSLDPADVLTKALVQTLRQAPLSGVLADVEEGPLGPVELDGHAGLLLLYAERLAEQPRAAWTPTTGPGRQYVELVFAERGLTVPAVPEATCLEGTP